MDLLYFIVEGLRRTKRFGYGRSQHSLLIKLGCVCNSFVFNNLLAMYFEFDCSDDARKMFDEMHHRTSVTWTTMVCGLNRSGKPVEAIRMYARMAESGIESPNAFTLSAVLKSCSLAGDLSSGEAVHARIRESFVSRQDVALMNSLMDMYVKCGRSVRDARKVFDEMTTRNSISWNTVISGYSREGDMEEALNLFDRMPSKDVVSWNIILMCFSNDHDPRAIELFRRMLREGVNPDQYTLPCVIHACGFIGLFDVGRQIHCFSIKSGFFEFSSFAQSALLCMYSNCGKLGESDGVFIRGSGSLLLWKSMASAYCANGKYSRVLRMVSGIRGYCLDGHTFAAGIKSCTELQSFRLGFQLHGLAVISDYELDSMVGTALVGFYLHRGSVRSALGIFERLPLKDVVAWAVLIAGCVENGFDDLGFRFFGKMIGSASVVIDERVISSALRACSSMANLVMGREIHGFGIKNGFTEDVINRTSLIDMYAKCGEIDDALSLFDSASARDGVCWTGIIVGCGRNGRVRDAMRLFLEMIDSGSTPNELTFSGILAAYRHTGGVAAALEIFQSMEKDHGLGPCSEHYCCLVHLLGQAGYVEEAEKLVGELPFRPDDKIWTSFLAGCGVGMNAGLAERFDRHLLPSSQRSGAINTAVSNAYAAEEKWENTARVRERVGSLTRKEDGRSWI